MMGFLRLQQGGEDFPLGQGITIKNSMIGKTWQYIGEVTKDSIHMVI